MDKVNLAQKFALIEDYWHPRTAGIVQDMAVKLVKVKGEFVWHLHENEDEMFFVVQGRLLIQFRDRDIWLYPGEFLIIPHGVEHRPVADEEVHIMLFEPQSTLNTGNVQGEKTVTDAEWI
jgi:mannose-6-phosphate isomerase-like protein (cupin superfamily)